MFRNAKTIAASLSLAALMISAVPTFAADVPSSQPSEQTPAKGGKGGQAERQQKMLDQLDLTDDQKKQIEPIMTQMKADLMSLRDDTSVPADQKKDKAKTIIGDAMKKIADILTPEQKAKMKELRDAKKGDKK